MLQLFLKKHKKAYTMAGLVLSITYVNIKATLRLPR
jgi:hypothetical protein